MNATAESIVTPEQALYGHTSEATAYVIADYPYGFRLRCKARVWLEQKKGKGFRMVMQTTNPKITAAEVWNKPKASTYADLAACLYLDAEGHIQWATVTFYDSAENVLRFVRRFPDISGDMRLTLRVWCLKKAAFAEGCLDGRVTMTINGVVKPWTEQDDKRHREELAVWQEAAAMLA